MIKAKIIFQDENIAAVNKPSGISVFQEKGDDGQYLKIIVEKQINQKLLPVHNLDKDASGILLFAKNKKGLDFISGEFKKCKIIEKYILLLSGTLENDEGIIDEPILDDGKKIFIAPHGFEAKTHFEVLEKFKRWTLVKAYPLTHIKHQIRIHFWKLGNPLAIDPKYSSPSPIVLSSFKRNYKAKLDGKEKPLIERLTMHLLEIEIGEIKMQAPLPDDFEITIKKMRKFAARGF
jgi:23S rRNA pseudouridine955/2504/2580 synthase/23S rRNA pseudouridine1911/1915/1917 synthase